MKRCKQIKLLACQPFMVLGMNSTILRSSRGTQLTIIQTKVLKKYVVYLRKFLAKHNLKCPCKKI